MLHPTNTFDYLEHVGDPHSSHPRFNKKLSNIDGASLLELNCYKLNGILVDNVILSMTADQLILLIETREIQSSAKSVPSNPDEGSEFLDFLQNFQP